MSGDVSEFLIKLALVCFGLQGVFGWLLRWRLEEFSSLSEVLFANPVLERRQGAGRLLRVKFFWPFVATPMELTESARELVALFWVARLSGFGFGAAMLAFFVSLFVQVGA
jgi:hypothetical protein